MAKQETPFSRGKLLVNLATKKEKSCANSDVHGLRPHHSKLERETKNELAYIESKKPQIPENIPLQTSDKMGQGDFKDVEKELLVTQLVFAMPPFENVNDLPQQRTAHDELKDTGGDQSNHSESSTSQMREEFLLVPSKQENLFILKPVQNTFSLEEEFFQHSTLEGEDDLFSNVNFTDVSFNLEQVLSEGMMIEGDKVGMELDLDLQEDINSEIIIENPAMQDSTKEKLKSITSTNVEQENIVDINDILSCKPNCLGQKNMPAKEIISEKATQMDLEQDSLEENVNNLNSSEEILRKRKRNKKPMKHLWTSEKNKEKRMKGEDYFGRRKNVFDVKRNKRQQKPRCPWKAERNSVFKCYKFTEERREKVFTDFWQLDWRERRILVNQLVDKRPVSYRRVNSLDFRRKGSLYYYLNIDDNEERLRVCKKMFFNTLSLGEWAVSNWISNSSDSQDKLEEEVDRGHDRENIDEVAQNVHSTNNNQKSQKDKSIRRKIVREFFDRLPKLESHYCRKSTNKLYLEPNFQSKAERYRHYQSYCESEGKESYIASDCLFYSVFNELNLGLFSPKNDQCDLCCSFNKGNLTQEEYNAYIVKKNLARSEKDSDKENTDERTAVFTMDMRQYF